MSPGSSLSLDNPQAVKVLRNTYALLSLTILFAAGIAALAVSNSWPAPGLIITLVGYFGLLFAVYKLQNSGWALPAVFALTGFMGYTLGPLLSRTQTAGSSGLRAQKCPCCSTNSRSPAVCHGSMNGSGAAAARAGSS